MKFRGERSVLPLGDIVFVSCVLACCCNAVPTWSPTWSPTFPPGCDYNYKSYSRGETIYEVPGCMGHGAYCDENGEVIVWDNFGYGCCERDGKYYEDGETVTDSGVTCYCEGSQGAEPAPMVCTESSTAPAIKPTLPVATSTVPQPATTDEAAESSGVAEKADEMQVWYNRFQRLMAEMLAVVQRLGECSAGPAASPKGT
ncbi:uncharacterized protein LOC118423476 [Branchiostoma floridae]|uniref:Uncharacterized protein LOC118423476 n=1 Tax=Branchiostoma floridae TaxID=7739 RepID=A0A9J7MZU9_BRAFL|nr:uncharacterized protein LOC118423476 [Branchiostoma floridae]